MNAEQRPSCRRCSVLILQGLASPFFAALGAALAERGHAVQRINFCYGDRLFWRLPGALEFRDRWEAWPDFLAETLDRLGVTDLVLFGDGRPLHAEALDLAAARGITPWVFEEGYVRPNWITLERGGTNGRSTLPRDAVTILAEGAVLPDRGEGAPVGGGMRRRVIDEVRYHLANFANPLGFPHYRHHRPWHPAYEMSFGWLPRLARQPLEKRRAERVVRDLVLSRRPFFLFPLQLDADVQIRKHSRFGRLAPVIAHVLASFAAEAPKDLLLLVKVHPLDNGLVDWRREVASRAKTLGIDDRVTTIDGGHLPTLLKHARGVVTVNSTTGFSALTHGTPVIALGQAIYALPGLTHQQGLAQFWSAPTPPDRGLFQAFRRVVIARTQLNGSFYTPHGIARGVAEAVARIETDAAVPAARGMLAPVS